MLFLFSEAEPALRLGDIAARLGLPKSTTSRFVSTLRDAGLLTRDPETRRYQLGARLLALESALLCAARDFPALARPFLQDLADRSGETAHLTERRGLVGVITELVESPHVLRMAPRRGQTVSLHAGALARTILAFRPPDEIDRILRQRPLQRLAPGTLGTPAAVKRALAEVRQVGYAVTLEEINAGACGVAAPLLGADDWAVGSIGLSGPMSRLTEDRRRELIGPVCRAARDLSRLIRHHPEVVAAPSRVLSAGR